MLIELGLLDQIRFEAYTSVYRQRLFFSSLHTASNVFEIEGKIPPEIASI